jgi:hypothetical protein
MSVVAPERGTQRAASVAPTPADLSVVICAYTEERWDRLVAAVLSVQRQVPAPREVVVVVDHNRALFERLRHRFSDVVLVENAEARGLSGARNTGIATATGAVIAFLDDDAEAEPGWLAALVDAHRQPDVLGAGGPIEAVWEHGRPSWFPPEFDWVVGCTYRGMPERSAPVRNLIGCNMALRREVIAATGGFSSRLGRVGTRPVGCEETALCIRAGRRFPDGQLRYETAAPVRHHVPARRAQVRYFLARCFAEGQSKARVSRLVGSRAGLSAERAYTFRTLPLGVLDNAVLAWRRRDGAALARAGLIVGGLAVTTAGYLTGRAWAWLSERGEGGRHGTRPPSASSAASPAEHQRVTSRA